MRSVFYSVGQDNITDRKIASTLTIINGIATFSTPQTGNIGVGDRITYNISDIVYISSKQSSNIWTVVTTLGNIPLDITNSIVISIKREFVSLSSALSEASDTNHLNTIDLVNNNYILNLPCYYDTGADTPFEIINWITGKDNYIKIYTPNNITEANINQRHNGKWDNTKYNLTYTGNGSWISLISISTNHVRIDGLQLGYTTSGGANFGHSISIRTKSDCEIYISNSILMGDSFHDGININNDEGAWTGINILKIWNNIIYGFNGTSSPSSIGNGIHHASGILFEAYIYNNTISKCNIGIRTIYPIMTLKNNISYNNNINYEDLFTTNSTNNLSGPQLTDAPGLNPRNGPNMFVTFVDELNNDFHLASNDIGARNYGTNLNPDPDGHLSFPDDIDGQTRPGQLVWDIGADQVSACPLIQIQFTVL